jgi:Metallo-peptidase family M12B Reprolysin-like
MAAAAAQLARIGLMKVQLGWRPASIPTKAGSTPALAATRRDIGLEISGDDPTVDDGAKGRVKILEAAGSGSSKGASESSTDRTICTFHGTWHRSGRGRSASLTFELFAAPGTTYSASTYDLPGYDPECTPGLGVDGFALTFVSRAFAVNFPFFIDSETEGRFIELKAIAESGPADSPTVFSRSPVLNVPIRRKRTVITTSKNPDGSAATFTDNVVGNVILHHESYLVQGARKASAASWPDTVQTEFFPMAPSAGAFASYPGLAANRKLRIFVNGDVADALLPEATDAIWKAKPLSGFGGATLRGTLMTSVRDAIVNTLKDVFVTDAGFVDGTAAILDPTSARDKALLQTLTGTVPFFTFLIERNDSLSEVAHSEELINSPRPVAHGGFDWLIETTFPIGGGDKNVKHGIQFRASYFSEHFAEFVAAPRPKGKPPLTAADVKTAAEKQGAKMAEVVAHEIGHSLGLMHDSELDRGADTKPSDENGVGPLRSIMCSLTDAAPYGAGVRFSNQAKIIWKNAFGTSPRLPLDSLTNKSWTAAEVFTTDWGERMHRVMESIGETALTRYPLDNNQVSPYPTAPSPQRGTYVPPP